MIQLMVSEWRQQDDIMIQRLSGRRVRLWRQRWRCAPRPVTRCGVIIIDGLSSVYEHRLNADAGATDPERKYFSLSLTVLVFATGRK